MGKLSGKVALVTGGAGGIGRAIARALAYAGADLGIVDRDEQRSKATADEIASLGVRTDGCRGCGRRAAGHGGIREYYEDARRHRYPVQQRWDWH